MLKVRTAIANGTLERDHAVGERGPAVRSGARRDDPQVLAGLSGLCGPKRACSKPSA